MTILRFPQKPEKPKYYLDHFVCPECFKIMQYRYRQGPVIHCPNPDCEIYNLDFYIPEQELIPVD